MYFEVLHGLLNMTMAFILLRMAPKRKNTPKGGASYDTSRFVIAEAFERYDKLSMWLSGIVS